MKMTDQTLLEQMKLHEVEILHRKQLINFSQRDADLLLNCRSFIQNRIDELVETFFEKQTTFEEIALIIGDADSLKRLKEALKSYIIRLFDGYYDLDYVNNRLRIGLVHKRIGVEPKYYLSAIKVLKDILVNTINQEIGEQFATDPTVKNSTIDALDKLLCFDTELVFDTYIRSLVSAIELARDKAEHYAFGLEKKVAQRTLELQELSRKDGLTDLYNHRAFIEFIKRDISFAKRNKVPLSLIYFDVDNFKTINDTCGHQAGDEILKAIGKILKEIARDVDVPCRYGGDEFCLILSGSTSAEAKKFSQCLIEQFSEQYSKITLSIGIAQTGPEQFDDHRILIKRADQSMYEAKKIVGFQMVTSPEIEIEKPA